LTGNVVSSYSAFLIKIKILKNSIANGQVFKGCVLRTFPPQILFRTSKEFLKILREECLGGGGVKKYISALTSK